MPVGLKPTELFKKSSAFPMRAELFCFIYLSTGKRSVNPRHQNNTELLLTIHLDYHRLFKADMTQEFRFFHRRLGVEEILIVDSVIHKGIDRKIAYAERSEVLEEVSSLTRVYTIIGQSGLHYHTGGGDMRHFTGMPSHVSLLPQRPGPTST